MRFEKHLNGLEEHLRIAGFSERTVETYGGCTKQFLEFLQEYYPRISSLEKVTKDVVRDYQGYLREYRDGKGSSLSNGTQAVKLKAIRKLFSYLMKADLILKDPTSVITFPKEEQRLPRNVPSEKQVADLLDRLTPRSPLELRNRAIVELLYACGIRTSELCSLKIGDVDLKEQTVTVVRGKGGKSRIVPIGQYATLYIRQYLEEGRKYMLVGRTEDPGYLFLSTRGNPFDKSSINKTVMKTVSRTANLKKKLSCYCFRHAVASHLLAHKVDVTYIAQLLGHSSLKTTQKYLRVEIGDLKRMHSLYHPRERDRNE